MQTDRLDTNDSPVQEKRVDKQSDRVQRSGYPGKMFQLTFVRLLHVVRGSWRSSLAPLG